MPPPLGLKGMYMSKYRALIVLREKSRSILQERDQVSVLIDKTGIESNSIEGSWKSLKYLK